MSLLNGYHQTRFDYDPRRETLWRCLYDFYFKRWIGAKDCVLELGAGYGHFINNIKARRRIAVDIWTEMPRHIEPTVEGHVGNVTDLAFVEESSVDFAFASNVFEHVTQNDFSSVLQQLKTKLSPQGLLCILQPNYRYAYRNYFDDFTHITVYSDVGLCDFLRACGYSIVECKPKFLPLTVKSRFKVHPMLIWLYLHLPVKPFGQQMLVLARPERH